MQFAFDVYQFKFGGDDRRPMQRDKTAATLVDALVEYARRYLNLKEKAPAQ